MIWLGIILIILAVGLVIGELFTGSGLLLVSGIAALIFGLVILFTQGSLFLQINWWLVIPLIILIIGLIIFIILRIINTYHHKAVTGKEDLEGKIAKVKETLDPEGTVFYQGEYWNAISKSGRIEPGEEVIIEHVDGLKLYVIKKPKS
jgi:membrane-bound serine protease (ClpP class)